jgi:hypothetical protein
MHRLTLLCVRRPWVVLVVVGLLAGVAGWSITRTRTAVGTDATLGKRHPTVSQFERFLERFGGGYPVLIAYECSKQGPCENALDPDALAMAHAVSQEMARSRFVSRVSSPATSRLLTSSGDLGIEARQLVVDGTPVLDPELERLARTDPLWLRTLLSEDGKVGAVVVELSSTETPALLSVMEDVRAALGPWEERGFRFHLVGEAVMWVAAHEDAESSAVRVGIGTGGMLFLTLLLLLRSLSAVLASLATIGVASAWTIGMLPLLGWELSELTNGAATLILVIGCADCVHFVAHYLETRSGSPSEADALVSTSRWVGAPCVLTTATTAASFASFASGGVHSLTQFGLLAATGVTFALILAFSLLPALLTLFPPRLRTQRHSAAWQEVLRRVAALGTRRRIVVLAASVGVVIIGATGVPRLRVELGLQDLWAPDHEISRALRLVSEQLQRADRLEIELSLPPGAHVEDPAVVSAVRQIEAEAGTLSGIVSSRSLLALLDRTRDLLHADANSSPGSESAIGEVLFLLSAGDPGVLDGWVTLDQQKLRISFEVQDLSLAEKGRLIASADELLERLVPPDWSYALTGTVVLSYRHGSDFGRSQISIVSASSFLVVVLIGLYLRSLSWALLAVIPNAVALLLLFGTMGHWRIPMDFGSAIVAPIAIGLATDDTVHFLTAYARERRSGLDPAPALLAAISGVGEAVIATAIALGLGFLSMTTSPFPSISNIGVLGMLAIVGATVADLIILPALIATLGHRKSFRALPAA